jgi:hypothetical protein
MTRNELERELDRRGGDLSAWPAALAGAARSAAARDPEAARLVREAAAFDGLARAALEPPPLPLGYATRIAARAIDRARPRWLDPRWLFALGSGWAAAACLAGFLVAGLVSTSDPDLLGFTEAALGTVQIDTEE